MKHHPKINVDIHVEGDVVNSNVTGVTLSAPDGWSRSFGNHSIFTTLFVQYLGLPSFQALQAQILFNLASRKGHSRKYERVRDLWGDVYWNEDHDGAYKRLWMKRSRAPIFPGTAVTLKDIQLTEFINSNIGVAYSYKRSRALDTWDWYSNKHDTLTPSFSWHDLENARSDSVTVFGLGDIRFTRPENDLHLLSVVSKGGAEFAGPLSSWEEEWYRYGPRPFELARRLYDFTQILRVSAQNIDQITLGGFPVLITTEVFNKIVDLLQDFGAAALKTLKGMLIQLPQEISLRYGAGIPHWCLLVGSPQHLQGLHAPEPTVCSAWTVTIDDIFEGDPKEKYLQWMFKVGQKDWRVQLQQAVEIIELVRDKVRATALFEFDEERNWFDTYTPFTPRTMRELFQKIQQKQHKGLEIFLGPIAGRSNHDD